MTICDEKRESSSSIRVSRSFKMVFFVWTILWALGIRPIQSVQFTPNSLAAKLRELDVLDWDIPTIVCLAHVASGLETNTIYFDNDAWKDNFYGIFGVPGGLLEQEPCTFLTMEGATDDSIDDDVHCLKVMIGGSGPTGSSRMDNIRRFSPLANLTECFNWWSMLPPFVNDRRSSTEDENKHLGTRRQEAEADDLHKLRELLSFGNRSTILLGVAVPLLAGLLILLFLILAKLKVKNSKRHIYRCEAENEALYLDLDEYYIPADNVPADNVPADNVPSDCVPTESRTPS